MKIRNKLRLVAVVTLSGFALVAAVTIVSLNIIQSAEDTSHRREAYVAELLDVKALALSTIMLDPALRETRDVFAAAASGIEQQGTSAQRAIRRPEVRGQLEGLLKRWGSYRDQSLQIIALAASHPKEANDKVMPLYKQEFQSLQADLEKFIAERRAEAVQSAVEARTITTRLYWMVCVLLGLGVVITLGVVLSVSRSLQSALDGILQRLEPLRQGDLTQRLPDRKHDELDEIASGVNLFVAELQSIVLRTRSKSEQLAGDD